MIYTVKQYLNKKKLAWSDRTYTTESTRLLKIANRINGDAESLYHHLKTVYSPYTLVSVWGRVMEIWELLDTTDNPYKTFKENNIRLFKNYYSRKEVPFSFEEAEARIRKISDKEVRAKANDLLHTGLRFSESQTEKDGYVVGKGNKIRKVFRPRHLSPVIFSRDYTTFTRHLKKVGLTSHMLRKLAATRLVELGLKEQDLCKVFGWSNFETAKYYIQPKTDENIQSLMEIL